MAVYVPLAAEVFLRIFAPAPMLPRYVCATPYGVKGNEPNRVYWHKTPECKVQVRHNSKGIRSDREIPYEKPEGMKRIVVLGDSFGMGYEVELEEMFTSQMEKHLQEAGINCEVVNLSVSGHSNAEELIMLRGEGFKYEPDLVLLAWHGSDPADNVRSNLYGLVDGELVRRSEEYLPAVEISEFLFRFRAYCWLAGECQLYSFAREKAAGLVKYQLLPLVRSITNARVEQKAGDGSADAQDDVQPYAQRLTAALVKEIAGEAQENGAAFLVLPIPARRSRTEFVSGFPSLESPASFVIYDPIEDFNKYEGQILYREKGHGHFTPLGCEIVGKGLAKTIVAEGLLD